ncbi:MAG: ribonuclease HI [Kofleriaceae bacterium]|nr:ribonuclease HI [Kofleriaceae bacterium]
MPWIKRNLRGKEVYVRVTESGEISKSSKGLVEILYKLSANSKIYNASAANLTPTGNPEDERIIVTEDAPAAGASPPKKTAAPTTVLPGDTIIIYTDGACSGNPGPMGIGAVIVDGEDRKEVPEFIGSGTNNIAELTAIERALQEVPEAARDRDVAVHTDSSYSIGLLDKNWKAKANAELVARIRKLTKEFSKLHFVKVKGHAGIPENERCDFLATSAITNR